MEKINRESFEKMTADHDKEKQEFINKAHEEGLKDNVAIDTHEATQNEQFLRDNYFSHSKEKLEAVIIAPNSQDYEAIVENEVYSSGSNTYTLNPEMQGIDPEGLQVFVPDLSAFNGKPLHEAMTYVNETYGDKYYVPGIEYWKWLSENPGKNFPSTDRKNGEFYLFPGSIIRGTFGPWLVPGVYQDEDKNKSMHLYELDRRLYTNAHIVLLEK